MLKPKKAELSSQKIILPTCSKNAGKYDTNEETADALSTRDTGRWPRRCHSARMVTTKRRRAATTLSLSRRRVFVTRNGALVPVIPDFSRRLYPPSTSAPRTICVTRAAQEGNRIGSSLCGHRAWNSHSAAACVRACVRGV